jgi:phage terminase large subunit GpA-like protein
MSDLSEISKVIRALPAELRKSLLASSQNGLEALRKPEDLSLPKWAHRHFYLSAESSQREEEWRAWPIQIGILFAMGDDNVEEFTFFKSARLGYTKCLLAEIGYTAQHQRRNQCVWQPSDGDSDDFVKTDLEPMLRDVKIMRKVFPRVLAKSKANTLQQKKFLGSLLKMRGGNAAGNYRRLTLAKAKADELDGFDQSIEKAGPPDTLIRKRVEGATYPKCIWGSTGRKKHVSHIERLYKASDIRMKFQISCPHCQAEHPLEWGGKKVAHGIKWDMHDPEGTVRHVCPHCREAITQGDYLRLARTGAWVSECGLFRLRHWWDENGEPCAEWTDANSKPCLPPKRVAMHCWTAYSEQPGVTWGKILREFLDAVEAMKVGNREPMIAWINETKGETYEEEAETADVNFLQTRAKNSGYVKGKVPMGGLLLVIGIDVQDNRFELVVWAVGRGEQMWAIDYLVVDANPADMRDWEALWLLIYGLRYRHVHGAEMRVRGASVDTGGHYTHQSYAFVRAYSPLDPSYRLFAVKGSSTPGDPIKAKAAKWMDITLKGRTTKRGVKLWMVGVDTAKDLFYGRLKITKPGPGYVNFASDLPSEFFRQYGNERRMKVRTNGQDAYRWVHTTGANEVVDCTDYALFTIEALGVGKFSEKQWKDLEAAVAPDLFYVPEDEPDPEPATELITDIMTVEPESKPQSPPQAVQVAQASASPAPNPFASEEWLSRG